jgi:septal ring factor EnvC (AmiA/AmiB activator)
METLENDLERVTADLAATEAELARLGARAEGLRAERDALTRALTALQPANETSASDIAGMVKNDAIVAVLRNARPRPLRAAGIVDALHQAGRTNEIAQNISVYLDGLLKQGRVVRVARGEYTVSD